MALDKDRLGAAIAAAITAQSITAGTPVTPTQLENLWKAVAKEIIDEFKNNSTVAVTGVTPGGGTAAGTIS